MSGADLIGLVGGLAGVLALLIEGYNHWKKRNPNFVLFAPYHFTGTDATTRQRMLFVLVRVANTSERVAHLYLETLRAEVFYEKRWYPMSVINIPENAPVAVDLPVHIQQHAGVNQIKFFNKFDPAVVSVDHPYSRYLIMMCANPNVAENAERLRLEFKDCNLMRYVLEAEILPNDPEHLER